MDAEFFKRVRSSYYVVSGNDQTAQEPSRAVLDALLEGKAQWGNNMQVCTQSSNATICDVYSDHEVQGEFFGLEGDT